MSLDVYLEMPNAVQQPRSAIFVREAGQTKEISWAEWNERFPDRAPVVVEVDESGLVFHHNITHNLVGMARAAGMYEYLWRPDELGKTAAHELIEPLRHGLDRLQATPDVYRALNPENGWGTYEGFVAFVETYLRACETYPEAIISVWR